MIFLSDLDGVGTEWDNNFDNDILTRYSHIPNFPLKHERKSFNFYDGQPEEIVVAIQEIMDRPGFYDELSPIEGWVDAMHEIQDEGHEVFIVTSPWVTNPTCVQDKFNWVARHLGEEWRSRVIITKDKTLVRGDVLVDDKPTITGAMIPVWEHVVYDQPYNQGLPNRRLTHWADWRITLPEFSALEIVR